jgi:hypothetical protein
MAPRRPPRQIVGHDDDQDPRALFQKPAIRLLPLAVSVHEVNPAKRGVTSASKIFASPHR